MYVFITELLPINLRICLIARAKNTLMFVLAVLSNAHYSTPHNRILTGIACKIIICAWRVMDGNSKKVNRSAMALFVIKIQIFISFFSFRYDATHEPRYWKFLEKIYHYTDNGHRTSKIKKEFWYCKVKYILKLVSWGVWRGKCESGTWSGYRIMVNFIHSINPFNSTSTHATY